VAVFGSLRQEFDERDTCGSNAVDELFILAKFLRWPPASDSCQARRTPLGAQAVAGSSTPIHRRFEHGEGC